MKTIYLSLFSLLLLLSCTSPQKLLEKGKYKKTMRVCLRKLSSGKVKIEYLEALEHAYAVLCAQDRQIYKTLKDKKEPSLWPMIYEKCLVFAERKKAVRKVEKRLNLMGYYPELLHLPVKEWIAESRRNASIYYYSQAQEYIPSARRGNRLAARKAYHLLGQCDRYETNFRDTPQLTQEMYDLGTTRILLNPRINPQEPMLTLLFFDLLFEQQAFPFRDDWQVFYYNSNQENTFHYELDLFYPEFYVSGDQCNSSRCCNSKEVICGYKEVEVWSEKDSVYYIEKEPIYEKISVAVITYHQNKSASVDLQKNYRDLASQRTFMGDPIRGCSSWDNRYSVVNGDFRALGFSCDDGGGHRQFYPSDSEMLRMAALNIKRRFYQSLRWDVDENWRSSNQALSSER